MPFHQQSVDSLNPGVRKAMFDGPVATKPESSSHTILIVAPEGQWSVTYMRSILLKMFMRNNSIATQEHKTPVYLLYSPDSETFAQFVQKLARLSHVTLGTITPDMLVKYRKRNVPLTFDHIYAFRSEIDPMFHGDTLSIRPYPADRVNQSPYYDKLQVDNFMDGGDQTPMQKPAQKISPDRVLDVLETQKERIGVTPESNPYSDMDYRPVRWTRIPLTLQVPHGTQGFGKQR